MSRASSCPVCGYVLRVVWPRTTTACPRCGQFPTVRNPASRPRFDVTSLWGDAIVIVALAVMAYFLPMMAYNALFSS
jgi:hypothetical protein